MFHVVKSNKNKILEYEIAKFIFNYAKQKLPIVVEW